MACDTIHHTRAEVCVRQGRPSESQRSGDGALITGRKTMGPRLSAPPQAWLFSALGFLSTTADNFMLLLVLWIAGPEGWSGVQTALVVLVLRVPSLLTGMLVGRAVDRWGARPVALTDLTVRAGALGLLLVVGLGASRLPLIAVLITGGLSGAASPATYAAIRWSIPRLVRPDRLGPANAVIGLSEQLPLLVGGALLGPSLTLFGTVASVAVPVAMLVLAIPLTRRLPSTDAVPPELTVATAEPGDNRIPGKVVALLALSVSYYLAYGPFQSVMPAFVRARMHADQNVYSLVWAMFGLGATLALPAGALLARRRPGLVNAAGAAIWGLLMLPIAAISTTAATAGLFLLGGIVWGPYTTVEVSALQRWSPAARHGFLFGLQRGLLGTAAPVGSAIGVIALHRVAPQIILTVSAAACAAAGLLALLHPDLRRSD
jgi:hypothetical protein